LAQNFIQKEQEQEVEKSCANLGQQKRQNCRAHSKILKNLCLLFDIAEATGSQ
jgi:flagellar motor switch protein FliG